MIEQLVFVVLVYGGAIGGALVGDRVLRRFRGR